MTRSRTVIVGEVSTGRRITQIPVASCSWSTSLRGGQIVADIPLRAEEFKRYAQEFVGGLYPSPDVFPSPETYPSLAHPIWKPSDGLRPTLLAALEPVRCFMAVVETDGRAVYVLEAGPIWRWDWDDSSGRLKVTAKAMRSLLDRRLVIGDLTDAWAEWAVTYPGLSLGTIGKRLVELTEALTGGGLPIVLPDDVAGSSTRTYNGFDLGTIGHSLDLLSEAEDGPEIAFEPRLTDDRFGVEWVMRVGDPLLTQGEAEDWSWSLASPQGPVAGVSLTRDASAMTNEVFAADSGMDTSRNIVRQEPADAGVVDLRGVGFPLLQSVVERQGGGVDGSISDATLEAWARAELQANQRPYSEVSLRVRTDQHPHLGRYRPGHWVRVWGNRHPLLSLLWPQEGYHRTRVAGISGDLGSLVDVALMPQVEVR